MLRTVAFLSAFLASGFLFAKTPKLPAQPPPKPFVLLDIPACADRAKIDDMISHVTQKTQFQTDNQYNIATSQSLSSVFGSKILSETTCSLNDGFRYDAEQQALTSSPYSYSTVYSIEEPKPS